MFGTQRRGLSHLVSSILRGERPDDLRRREGLIKQASKRLGLLARLRQECSNQIAAQGVVIGVGSRQRISAEPEKVIPIVFVHQAVADAIGNHLVVGCVLAVEEKHLIVGHRSRRRNALMKSLTRAASSGGSAVGRWRGRFQHLTLFYTRRPGTQPGPAPVIPSVGRRSGTPNYE
jgi:hypothetical protein